jgi:hypothetical protein
MYVDWIQLAQDMVQWAGSSGCSNGYIGSIKGRQFLDQLSNYQLLRKALNLNHTYKLQMCLYSFTSAEEVTGGKCILVTF